MTTNQRTIQLPAFAISLILVLSTMALAHGDQQHVMGTVTKVETESISVKTTTGEVKVVIILPTTKFVKGTAGVTLQEIKVGDRVVIHAKPEGNVLNATEVKIGESKDPMHHD